MRFLSKHFKMKTRFLRLLIFTASLFAFQTIKAQEFKCDIRINSNQISGTDKTVFQNLQTALYDFINNTKWTGINFKSSEKIECSLVINIKERTDSESYSGEINMVLRRPTYKATYNTPIFNYIDTHFLFSYIDGQSLDFNPNTFSSDLTSTIAYYLYMFLGFEFDTFSLYGGEGFYKIAESIVNSAQSTNEIGWQSNNRQNRYWLCENLTNSTYQPLRQFLYEYHRLGLDVMSERPDEGRAAVATAIEYLQPIYERYPTCYFFQLLLETKRDEIVNIFSEGTQQEKVRVTNILKQIDPSQSTKYDAILQSPSKF